MGTTEKIHLYSFIQIFRDIDESPLNLLFSRLNRHSFHPLPVWDPTIISVALCWILLNISMPLFLRSSEPSRALQMWPYQCWLEAKDYFPQVPGRTLNAGQETISLFCEKGTLLTHIQFGVQQDLQAAPDRAASSWRAPSSIPTARPRVFLSQMQTLHFHLLDFMRFLSAHFQACQDSSGCQHNPLLYQPLLTIWCN